MPVVEVSRLAFRHFDEAIDSRPPKGTDHERLLLALDKGLQFRMAVEPERTRSVQGQSGGNDETVEKLDDSRAVCELSALVLQFVDPVEEVTHCDLATFEIAQHEMPLSIENVDAGQVTERRFQRGNLLVSNPRYIEARQRIDIRFAAL